MLDEIDNSSTDDQNPEKNRKRAAWERPATRAELRAAARDERQRPLAFSELHF